MPAPSSNSLWIGVTAERDQPLAPTVGVERQSLTKSEILLNGANYVFRDDVPSSALGAWLQYFAQNWGFREGIP